MTAKTNLQTARPGEWSFRIIAGITISILSFETFVAESSEGGREFMPLWVLTCLMVSSVFRLTHAYKQEIAELNSTDAADAAATEDTE